MTPPTAATVPVRRRRFLIPAAGLVLAAAGGFVGWTVYRNAANDRLLRDALAEVEAADPRWRLEQIEADRATVPDAENSAVLIRRAKARLTRRDPTAFARRKQSLAGLSPEVRLSDEQYAGLIAGLERDEAAVGPALALARYPRGRHPITFTPDYLHTLLTHVGDCGDVQWQVLEPLTLVLIHEGDTDGALSACHAMLNLARSFGDEPIAPTQCARTRFARSAIRSLERVLSQGDVPESALAAVRAELAAEAEYDPWAVCIRGERAILVQVLEAVHDGRIEPSFYRGWLTPAPAPKLSLVSRAGNWIADHVGLDTRGSRAWALRYLTRLVDAGRLPWPERRSVVAAATDGPEPVRLVGPQIDNLMTVLQSAQARGRCAVIGVALERHRLRHGRWPETLAALVPEFLPAVPTDPFDGRPLRYKRLANGVVVYSIGTDLADDGGKLADTDPSPTGTDLGFRLWDVPYRGQPPRTAPEVAP